MRSYNAAWLMRLLGLMYATNGMFAFSALQWLEYLTENHSDSREVSKQIKSVSSQELGRGTVMEG